MEQTKTQQERIAFINARQKLLDFFRTYRIDKIEYYNKGYENGIDDMTFANDVERMKYLICTFYAFMFCGQYSLPEVYSSATEHEHLPGSPEDHNDFENYMIADISNEIIDDIKKLCMIIIDYCKLVFPEHYYLGLPQ